MKIVYFNKYSRINRLLTTLVFRTIQTVYHGYGYVDDDTAVGMDTILRNMRIIHVEINKLRVCMVIA